MSASADMPRRRPDKPTLPLANDNAVPRCPDRSGEPVRVRPGFVPAVSR